MINNTGVGPSDYNYETGEPLRKQFKPAFSEAQFQGRLTKLGTHGRTREFIYNDFCNEIGVTTALIGDSIVDNICLNGCFTYSLSGGHINDFFYLLPTLKSYNNIIIALGGNNLSHYNEAGEEPWRVLEQMQSLRNAMLAAENSPNVVCTVLRRLRANHELIARYNELLINSDMSTFKLHREVTKRRKFNDDGIHLTLKGRRAFACAMKKLRLEKFGEDLSF